MKIFASPKVSRLAADDHHSNVGSRVDTGALAQAHCGEACCHLQPLLMHRLLLVVSPDACLSLGTQPESRLSQRRW